MFNVETTTAADQQIAELVIWLRENGTAARFITELAVASRILGIAPRSGVPVAGRAGVRRFLLRRSQVHLYYSLDETQTVVTIRAIWHTARGTPPPP